MDQNVIHTYRSNSFSVGKLVILMIPAMVFLLILSVYITVSTYKNRVAAAHTSNTQTQVLGTNR